jgi:hypothetical protein
MGRTQDSQDFKHYKGIKGLAIRVSPYFLEKIQKGKSADLFRSSALKN